jgi:hypothetical protein
LHLKLLVRRAEPSPSDEHPHCDWLAATAVVVDLQPHCRITVIPVGRPGTGHSSLALCLLGGMPELSIFGVCSRIFHLRYQSRIWSVADQPGRLALNQWPTAVQLLCHSVVRNGNQQRRRRHCILATPSVRIG